MSAKEYIGENKPMPKTKKVKTPVSPTRIDDPFVGQSIGNCVIQEKIAEGGSAYIYKAFNVHFELPRVVKILKPALVYEEESFFNFKQEAQFTARLDHINIRRVFDTGEFGGHFFIEMDYIEGQSLRDFLGKRKRIPEAQALSIALQIAKALDYAHNIQIITPSKQEVKGILHRDIKPENIMLNARNHVYVMDFGAAKPLSVQSEGMPDMVVGTFHYMAPEQLEGKELDMRSDFFSLGIVMYELLSGRKPFSGESLAKLVEKIKKAKYIPLKKRRRSISPLTQELIANLLNRKPKHRPSSAKEIIKDLQVCIQAYESWGRGEKVKIPFSWRKFFPALSMVFSITALVFSFLTWWSTGPTLPGKEKKAEYMDSSFLLDEGRSMEEKRMWRAAIQRYESVPTPKKGGRPDEYLEARIRTAHLSFSHFNQFTKARSILESLRQTYGDPSIDAYLGQIYFRLALYEESIERLERALESSKGSVVPVEKIKKESQYYLANALDGRYTFLHQTEEDLDRARSAWNLYIDKYACSDNKSEKACAFALKRIAQLKKLE